MNQKKLDILKHFVGFCKKELDIQSLPKISLITDKSFVENFRSFGEYNPGKTTIRVFIAGRNLADICRSLAHELVHHRQNELDLIYDTAGETGTEVENDANSIAGIIMREYGKLNLGIYDLDVAGQGLSEAKFNPENEIFSAYNNRYFFDITKAYELISKGKVKSVEKEFDPVMLNQFSHPEFSAANPEKVAAMEIDYSKPLGILVKFQDPESEKTEWILIDGNHRVRKAAQEKQPAKLFVISNPEDVKKFMKVDPSKPHKLFPDDEE